MYNSLLNSSELGLSWGTQPSGGGGSLKQKDIFDGGLSVASQLISAFSGKNGGQQIYRGVNVVPAAQRRDETDTPVYYGGQPAGAGVAGYAPGTAGGAVGSGVDGFVGWIGNNPLLVVLGLGGLYLLMKEPPRRR